MSIEMFINHIDRDMTLHEIINLSLDIDIDLRGLLSNKQHNELLKVCYMVFMEQSKHTGVIYLEGYASEIMRSI